MSAIYSPPCEEALRATEQMVSDRLQVAPIPDFPESLGETLERAQDERQTLYLFITGGRDYSLTDADYALLDSFNARYQIAELVHGGATGADAGAGRWARGKGIRVRVFAADWFKHGNAAGPMRNSLMAAYAQGIQDTGAFVLLLAFPGNRGTRDMARKAKTAGIEVQFSMEVSP